MKANFFKLIPLACMLAASASAGVYQIVSGDNNGYGNAVTAAGQTNGGVNNTGLNNAGVASNTTYNVNPNSAWANIKLDSTLVSGNSACGANGVNCAKWVSLDTTSTPAPQIGNTSWVEFNHTFTLNEVSVVSSNFTIFADDLADVRINGNLVYDSNNTGNSTCNTSPIGCIVANVGRVGFGSGNTIGFSSLTPFLNGSGVSGGVNTLSVRVFQTNGSGFGTAYLANITTVPEPGFYGLLSVGVGALLFRARRRSA